VPRIAEIAVDPLVIATTGLASAAIAMIFGASPVLLAARADLQVSLRGAAGGTASRGSHRLRGVMVVAEVALAVVLATGSGLMLRTMWHLSRVDVGFDGDRVLGMRVQRGQPFQSPAEGRAFYRAVLDRIAALPGVERVGAIQHLPMSGYHWRAALEVEGQPLPRGTAAPSAGWRIVAGDYFQTMRIPVLSGALSAFPGGTGAPAVVVNQAFAQRVFGRGDPVGRRIRTTGGRQPGPWTTIAAVVGNVRHDGPDQPAPAEVYSSLEHTWMPAMSLTIRFRLRVAIDAMPVRSAIWSVDPQVPVAGIEPVRELVARRTARPRAVAVLLSAFATVALLLGAVGVYGVVAQSVTQRTREIGVRLALGAPRARVSRAVVLHGLVLGAAGVVIGAGGALVLTRGMAAVIAGVTPHDGATLAGASACLLSVTALAAYVPARRAARIDPLGALRQE
jgi:predicted permease